MSHTASEWTDQLEACGLLSHEAAGRLRKSVRQDGTLDELLLAARRDGALTTYQCGEVSAGQFDGLDLGAFVVIDRLGQGGMGTVYKARCKEDGRTLALKLLPVELRDDQQALSRLRREVETSASLIHPHIVQTVGFEETNRGPALLMEVVDGRDLAQIVRDGGPVNAGELLGCLTQVADALRYSHERGVIHRDIKPSNLLVDQSATIRVTDFGVARRNPSGEATTITQLTTAGTVLGTVAFMAPEQAMQSTAVDARSDLYSLGCTMFFLAHARPPFDGETEVEILLAHVENDPPRLAVRGPSALRRPLELIYRKLIAKAPDDRFQSAGELLTSIAKIHEQADRRANRRAWVASGSMALAIAGLLMLSVSLAIGRTMPPPPPWKAGPNTDVDHASAEPVPRRVRWTGWNFPAASGTDPLAGFVPDPAQLPGNTGWQIHPRTPNSKVMRIAWSPDGKRIYLATTAGRLWIHDVESRESTGPFIPHSSTLDGPYRAITGLAVHPDGHTIATASHRSRAIHLWDEQFEHVGTIGDNIGGATRLAWSPNGQWLASASGNGLVRVWDTASQALLGTVHHEQAASDVSWHAGGSFIASVAGDRTVRVSNFDGTELWRHEGKEEFSGVSWHPDGRHLAWSDGNDVFVAQFGETLAGGGPVSPTSIQSFVAHDRPVIELTWSPDGQWLATTSSQNVLKIWYEAGQYRRTLSGAAWSTAVAWDPTSSHVAVEATLIGVQILDVVGGDALSLFSQNPDIQSLDWRPDGSRFASGHGDGALRVWSEDGRLLQSTQGHTQMSDAVRWNHAGSLLASGGQDGRVQVWDAELTRQREYSPGVSVSRGAVAWSDDDRWVGAGLYVNAALWELDGDGQITLGHGGRVVNGFDWHPGGLIIATGDSGGTIRLWDPAGKMLAEQTRDGQSVRSLDWNHDGSQLAFGSQQVEIFGQDLTQLSTIPAVGNSVRFSPNGSHLAFMSDSITTRIWTPGGKVTLYNKHVVQSFAHAWHPTRPMLLTGGHDGTIHAWNPYTGESYWVVITLSSGNYATFAADGRLIHGDPDVVDSEFAVIARDGTHNTRVHRVSEFFGKLGIAIDH